MKLNTTWVSLNQLKGQILEKENDIKDNQVKLDLTQTQFTEREKPVI